MCLFFFLKVDSARLLVVVMMATHDGVSMTLIYRQIVNHSIPWGRLSTRQMTASSRHDLAVRAINQERVLHGRKMTILIDETHAIVRDSIHWNGMLSSASEWQEGLRQTANMMTKNEKTNADFSKVRPACRRFQVTTPWEKRRQMNQTRILEVIPSLWVRDPVTRSLWRRAEVLPAACLATWTKRWESLFKSSMHLFPLKSEHGFT